MDLAGWWVNLRWAPRWVVVTEVEIGYWGDIRLAGVDWDKLPEGDFVGVGCPVPYRAAFQEECSPFDSCFVPAVCVGHYLQQGQNSFAVEGMEASFEEGWVGSHPQLNYLAAHRILDRTYCLLE